MRAVLIATVVALLGAGHAMADERCWTAGKIIAYLESRDPTLRHSILILASTFLIVGSPTRDEFLIVEFRFGCMAVQDQVKREQLQTWLETIGRFK